MDLWTLYDSCRTFRICSARFLFQVVEVRFDGEYPSLLNSRSFPPRPNRLLSILKQWSPHVRKIDLWGDEDSIEPEFLKILDTLGNLRAFRHVYYFPLAQPDDRSSQISHVRSQATARSYTSTTATSVSISGDISSQLHAGYSHPLSRSWQAERQLTKVCATPYLSPS